MSDGISILDVIRRGGYEASLMTTFNATLPFYEEVVLRKLVGAGCRHNVVLMDDAQCATSWASEATRPRLAGHAYTLVPVKVPGAFHPKVCILAGPRKASILVGSHNLTLSGFGYNREVTNWVDIRNADNAQGTAVLAYAWRAIAAWLERERGRIPGPLADSALAFSNFVTPLIAKAGSQEDAILLMQYPGSAPLLDQVGARVPADVTRIAVLGAFFDARLEYVKALEARWPNAQIVVGIDPDTVELPSAPGTGASRFVDARELWPRSNSYLHAKAIYFEAGDTAALVSGSANPSRPAWMGADPHGNTEAVLLRLGPAAKECAATLCISKLFELSRLQSSVLQAAVARSAISVLSGEEAPESLLLGVADHQARTIEIVGCRQDDVARADALDADGALIGQCAIVEFKASALVFSLDADVALVRSILLWRGDSVLARAMVHHPEQIANAAQSSRQNQIRGALASLGSNDADISHVIAAVERVIFAEDVPSQTKIMTQGDSSTKARADSPERPDSLGIHVADMPKQRKKLRLLKAGDLAYLLDVLIRRLGVGLEPGALETDQLGRTEEERIGQDDEHPGGPDGHPKHANTLSDIEIAKVVVRKARKLIARMLSQLERSVQDEDLRLAAVIQLVAVLALIRELRHLDKQSRWRRTGQLLVEEKDRRRLLEKSTTYLLGSKAGLLHRAEESIGAAFEEAGQLRVLLLWLAWDLGEELTDKINRFWAPEEIDRCARAKGFFLELLPEVMREPSEKEELERSISHTMRNTPADATHAQEWLDRHWSFGRRWSAPYSIDMVPPLKIQIGDVCVHPGRKSPELRVAIRVDDQFVHLWDFDHQAGFRRDKVVCLSRSQRE